MSELQYRSAELVYREEDTGGILEGRMVPYSVWTEINSAVEGHFMERVMPGALAKTLMERAKKLRVLFQHGRDILGAQPIAAIEEVRDEGDGPYYRAGLFPNLPPMLMDGLRAGVYGTSVSMRPLKTDAVRRPKRSEHNPDGIEERSITEAKLREISVVTFPAYEGATASVRSLTDEFLVGRLLEHPERLLELVREQTEEEPSHSEPPPQEDPAEERGAETLSPEKTSPPVPKRDWLAPTEEEPGWRLP